jgi:hypothetical protein
MVPLRSEQTSRLALDYASNGYAILPRLVDPDVASAWELKHRSLPGKMVHVGREFHTKWLEQKFPEPARALDELGLSGSFISLAERVTGLDSIDQTRSRVWINRYRPGEHVPEHCDRAGSTQLVLCLQGLAQPEQGGELFVRDEVVNLATGDAVLFFARGVPHGTIRIGGSAVGPSGFSRVTCVFRFFATDDLSGAPR